MREATLTAEELGWINLPGKRTELIRGRMIVREPAGWAHGVVSQRVATALANYAEPRGLGLVFGAETGFTLFRGPDTVRAADAAFISSARIPTEPPRGYAEMAPDLIVEVLSPEDRPRDVHDKVRDWLNAGVRLVWVVDPRRRLAIVHRLATDAVTPAENDILEGEDVLPGFRVSLKRLLIG